MQSSPNVVVLERIKKAMNAPFSPVQEELILTSGVPLNGLSCAGSGKTTTIIGKLLYMQLALGFDPRRIIAISFNAAAVEEMKARHASACEGLSMASAVNFRTYHSLFLHYLKKFNKSMNIADDSRFKKQFNQICRRHIKDCNEEAIENVESVRGFALNNLILTKEELMQTPKFLTTGLDPDQYFAVVKEYSELKKKNGVWDFDDLLLEFYKLMRSNARAREMVQNDFDAWIVDEYQDISKIQIEILKIAIKDKNNFVTIGDDDQSIYEFRGSKVDYIVDFPKDFPGAHRIKMETNYRCPANILNPIANSIAKNSKRVPKKMIPHNDGGSTRFIPATSNAGASWVVAEEIASKVTPSTYHEFAVLYRNLKQQMFIVDMLIQKGIPVKTSAANLIYNHFIVGDLSEIVNLALSPTDCEAFKKVFSKITSYVKRDQITAVYFKSKKTSAPWYDLFFDNRNESIDIARDMLDEVAYMISENEPFAKIILRIREQYTGWLDYLIKVSDLTETEVDDVFDYLAYIGENRTYQQFLQYMENGKKLVSEFKKDTNAVTLSTMHKMKGLEYAYVYLLFCTEEHVPNAKIETRINKEFGADESREYIEQERRLFYVAWTRAKKELVVTFSYSGVSRFVLESVGSSNKLRELSEPEVKFNPAEASTMQKTYEADRKVYQEFVEGTPETVVSSQSLEEAFSDTDNVNEPVEDGSTLKSPEFPDEEKKESLPSPMEPKTSPKLEPKTPPKSDTKPSAPPKPVSTPKPQRDRSPVLPTKGVTIEKTLVHGGKVLGYVIRDLETGERKGFTVDEACFLVHKFSADNAVVVPKTVKGEGTLHLRSNNESESLTSEKYALPPLDRSSGSPKQWCQYSPDLVDLLQEIISKHRKSTSSDTKSDARSRTIQSIISSKNLNLKF